jgi:hypothetical protein
LPEIACYHPQAKKELMLDGNPHFGALDSFSRTFFYPNKNGPDTGAFKFAFDNPGCCTVNPITIHQFSMHKCTTTRIPGGEYQLMP